MARFTLQPTFLTVCAALVALACTIAPGSAQSGPTIVAAYSSNLSISTAGSLGGNPTQMAWGPDGRLYVQTQNNGVWSYAYNKATGAISNPIHAVTGEGGIGIAFHGRNEMYLSEFGPNHFDSIYRLTGPDAHGVWGGAGQVNVPIVSGIPVGDHDVDQIQIVGDTLYVGIGRRTINGYEGVWTSGSLDDYGGKGFWSGGVGKTFGDCAYGGTIAMIKNLKHVVSKAGAANTLNPKYTWQQTIQGDTGPYKDVNLDNKLIVHSAGTRNPFGLCLDENNNLYFTVNFNRVMTQGDGVCGFGLHGDLLDSDFAKDVHDQLFKATYGADYGYTSSNWVNHSPFLMRKQAGHVVTRSITFDNLWNPGPYPPYDAANPVGLGPSASADGCAFWYNSSLPSELLGDIFIVRYNSPITEASPGTVTITYADLVAVDVTSGTVRQIATGFKNPLCVISDPSKEFLLIGDYGSDTLYAISAH